MVSSPHKAVVALTLIFSMLSTADAGLRAAVEEKLTTPCPAMPASDRWACLTGFAGPSCEFSRADNCNGRGNPSATGTPCTCDAGSAGPSCEYSRAKTCNNRGNPSSTGACKCDSNYEGPTCANFTGCDALKGVSPVATKYNPGSYSCCPATQSLTFTFGGMFGGKISKTVTVQQSAMQEGLSAQCAMNPELRCPSPFRSSPFGAPSPLQTCPLNGVQVPISSYGACRGQNVASVNDRTCKVCSVNPMYGYWCVGKSQGWSSSGTLKCTAADEVCTGQSLDCTGPGLICSTRTGHATCRSGATCMGTASSAGADTHVDVTCLSGGTCHTALGGGSATMTCHAGSTCIQENASNPWGPGTTTMNCDENAKCTCNAGGCKINRISLP